MVFWLVSLQLGKQRKEAVWELLQEKTSAAALSSNYKLEIPELRVGTLDSLMALSDELSRTSQMMETVVNKVKRQVNDAGGATALASLKVEGLSTEAYVQRFKWDEAKFPARRPLKETVEKMAELVSRIEDDLKVRLLTSGLEREDSMQQPLLCSWQEDKGCNVGLPLVFALLRSRRSRPASTTT